MRLADFIEQNAEIISQRAQEFAETQAPSGLQLSGVALRNDIPVILKAIILDLRTPQSAEQELAKSQGRASDRFGTLTAAHSHGRARAKDGFGVNQMIAEFRALRASILRLWAADESYALSSMEDMIRFNEAIDQAVAESTVDYTKEVELWRNMFLGVLGHDLRGPLSAIVMTSEIMVQRTEGTPLSVLAERMVVSGKRMSTLLDNLLDYNRSKLGVGMQIEPSSCRLDEAVQDEIELLRAVLPGTIIDFSAEAVHEGRYDASRVREALHNLVTNASKYGDAGTSIEVTLTSMTEGTKLSVSNHGVPLSSESLDNLFEPLRRGPLRADVGEEASLGLGLFVVREVASAHGGNVTVNCADGKTTFTIWLPNKANLDSL